MPSLTHAFRQFLHSFKVPGSFFTGLIVDAAFWLLLVLLFALFGTLISGQVATLSNGRAPEQLQEMLTTLQPDQLQSFVAELRTFMLVLFAGLAGLLLYFLLAYPFRSKLIWSALAKTKTKYFRWIGLDALLLLFLLVYILLLFIVNIVLSALKAGQLVTAGATMVLLLVFALYAMLASFHFSHRYRVFESISHAFSTIKTKFKAVGIAFILSAFVLIALFVLLIPVTRALALYPIANVILQAVLLLLYLAWLRVYVVNVVAEA